MPSSGPASLSRTAQVYSESSFRARGTYSRTNDSACARVYGHGVVRNRSNSGSVQYSAVLSTAVAKGPDSTRRSPLSVSGSTSAPAQEPDAVVHALEGRLSDRLGALRIAGQDPVELRRVGEQLECPLAHRAERRRH